MSKKTKNDKTLDGYLDRNSFDLRAFHFLVKPAADEKLKEVLETLVGKDFYRIHRSSVMDAARLASDEK